MQNYILEYPEGDLAYNHLILPVDTLHVGIKNTATHTCTPTVVAQYTACAPWASIIKSTLDAVATQQTETMAGVEQMRVRIGVYESFWELLRQHQCVLFS